ncbi:uncharacterized protein G2W53_003629 [Senna tora]|uniref:Uncharacterized protein n=1 Tax=Senna tora TaxID=362788 RepID=A0A835CFX0_9FABA|nr:uncharacterized protein G2W53_003629 [Senna tora]
MNNLTVRVLKEHPDLTIQVFRPPGGRNTLATFTCRWPKHLQTYF